MTDVQSVTKVQSVTDFESVTEFPIAEMVQRLKDRLAREDRLITAFSGGAHAAGSVARIEVPQEDLGRLLDRREEISGLVRAAGFVFAAADLAGLRSGSMNALLPLSVAHRAG